MRVGEQLQQRARARCLGAGHPDAAAVDVTGISLVVAATKWDAFAAAHGAREQQAVAGALRALAHANGAHLFFIGGLGGRGAAAAAAGELAAKQQAAAVDAFMRTLHHLAFHGAHKKM